MWWTRFPNIMYFRADDDISGLLTPHHHHSCPFHTLQLPPLPVLVPSRFEGGRYNVLFGILLTSPFENCRRERPRKMGAEAEPFTTRRKNDELVSQY